MAKIKDTNINVKEIDLSDLVIGKGQHRVKDVGKDLDDLVESIRVMGLLEPIVVCPSATSPGRYEILTGQRRFLAHKQLKKKTIMATVMDKHVPEDEAKAISLTENLIRRDPSVKETIDACTSLYKKYTSIQAVAEATGIRASLVSQYVKYDRLIPALKKMVDEGKCDIKVAIRAQDAAAAGDEKADSKEAVKLAKEMTGMSGIQQKKLVRVREENPEQSVDDVIEEAKSGGKITQIVVTLGADVHKLLQAYATQEGTSQDDAAATLIEEALTSKGLD